MVRRNGAAVRLYRLTGWPYARRHLPRYGLLVAGVALGVAVAVAIQGGARSVLAAHPTRLVEVDDPGCLLDIDTPPAD